MSNALPTFDQPLVEGEHTSRVWYKFFSTINAVTVNAPSTVSTLPANPDQGDRGFVTDATSTTFLAQAVGGGVNAVPVTFNGSIWVIG